MGCGSHLVAPSWNFHPKKLAAQRSRCHHPDHRLEYQLVTGRWRLSNQPWPQVWLLRASSSHQKMLCLSRFQYVFFDFIHIFPGCWNILKYHSSCIAENHIRRLVKAWETPFSWFVNVPAKGHATTEACGLFVFEIHKRAVNYVERHRITDE